MGRDDGGGPLQGEGDEEPGGEGGGGVHHPHCRLAHHHVAGVQVVPATQPTEAGRPDKHQLRCGFGRCG